MEQGSISLTARSLSKSVYQTVSVAGVGVRGIVLTTHGIGRLRLIHGRKQLNRPHAHNALTPKAVNQ